LIQEYLSSKNFLIIKFRDTGNAVWQYDETNKT